MIYRDYFSNQCAMVIFLCCLIDTDNELVQLLVRIYNKLATDCVYFLSSLTSRNVGLVPDFLHSCT